MKLLLIRHGETVQNRDGIIQGQQPGELSPLGLQQREHLAERLRSDRYDHIYCSDLARTRATLAPLAERLSVDVDYRVDIRERHFGTYEGARWKEYGQYLKEQQQDRVSLRPPEGENFHDLKARTDQFLAEIIDQHMGKTVLVMSHGGAIRTMIAQLINDSIQDLLEREIHNTSISWFSLEADQSDKGFQVLEHTLNDYAHLDELYK